LVGPGGEALRRSPRSLRPERLPVREFDDSPSSPGTWARFCGDGEWDVALSLPNLVPLRVMALRAFGDPQRIYLMSSDASPISRTHILISMTVAAALFLGGCQSDEDRAASFIERGNQYIED
jgi:hypothetical protein